ncbi:MAG: hypothetical protein JNK04_19890 [Myxococcales bacterium]|nr:hypothetical protein [Myxococcales bacterium]
MRIWLAFVAACGSAPPATPPARSDAAPPPSSLISDAACIPRTYAASPITMADESDRHGIVCYSIVGDATGSAEQVATAATRRCFAVDTRGALVEELSPAEAKARSAPVLKAPELTLTGDRAKVCMPTGSCAEVTITRGPREAHEALDYIGATDSGGRYVATVVPEPAGEMWAELYDVLKGTRLGRMKLAVPEAPHAFTDPERTHIVRLVGRGAIVSELTEPAAIALFDIAGGKGRYLNGDDGVWIAVNDSVLANRRDETLELIETTTLATRATVRALGTEVPHFFQGTVRKVGDTVLFFGENPPNVSVIDAKTLQVTPARAFRLCDSP